MLFVPQNLWLWLMKKTASLRRTSRKALLPVRTCLRRVKLNPLWNSLKLKVLPATPVFQMTSSTSWWTVDYLKIFWFEGGEKNSLQIWGNTCCAKPVRLKLNNYVDWNFSGLFRIAITHNIQFECLRQHAIKINTCFWSHFEWFISPHYSKE